VVTGSDSIANAVGRAFSAVPPISSPKPYDATHSDRSRIRTQRRVNLANTGARLRAIVNNRKNVVRTLAAVAAMQKSYSRKSTRCASPIAAFLRSRESGRGRNSSPAELHARSERRGGPFVAVQQRRRSRVS